MERFIQLNLRSDPDKSDPAQLPNPERKEPESAAVNKRLHRLLNKAAHKAAAELGRNRAGIFSK